MQQYRMETYKVATPKCLFHVATQIEKDQYTLIEQPANLILAFFTNIIQLYN